MTTFIDQFCRGQISADRINDHIDAWHQCLDTDQLLHEYLGMTWEQYSRWVKDRYCRRDWDALQGRIHGA